jgi:hypothetical protein
MTPAGPSIERWGRGALAQGLLLMPARGHSAPLVPAANTAAAITIPAVNILVAVVILLCAKLALIRLQWADREQVRWLAQKGCANAGNHLLLCLQEPCSSRSRCAMHRSQKPGRDAYVGAKPVAVVAGSRDLLPGHLDRLRHSGLP